MTNWNEIAFKDFIQLKRGYDLPNEEIIEGNFPIIASTSIKGHHKFFKAIGPGVITGRSGSLGKVQYIEKNYWPLNTTLYVCDFKNNYPLFVYYFLKTLRLENFDSGAGVPTLNQNHLHRLKIKIPPLEIQHKIAAMLSAYDELIEVNRQRIAALEQAAEELYREWFVRMRFPGYEHTPIEHGIPQGWEVVKLGEILSLEYGKALKDEDRKEGIFPVFGSSGIVGMHEKALTTGPGIVVGRKGNVGSVFWSERDFYTIDTAFFVVSKISYYFLYFKLKMMSFINNDAAVPGLNRNQAYNTKSFFPSEELIHNFETIVKSIFDNKYILEQQNQKLQTIRDQLLPKLMAGTLDLSDLDVHYPPSMHHDL